MLGLERDIIALLDFVTPAIERVLHGALEWCVALITVIVYLVPLITRRYRLFWYILAANVLALGLMWAVLQVIDRNAPELLVNRIAARAGIDRSTSSGELGFAQLTSQFVVLAPFVSSRVPPRRLVTLGAARRPPLRRLLPPPRQRARGPPRRRGRRHRRAARVRAARSPPHRRRDPRRAHGRRAPRRSTCDRASVDARGSAPYFATMADGGQLFVKVLGEAERAADLMFRAYRFLRLKDVGDDRPFSSLRRTVEHEALVSLVARDIGVRTPAPARRRQGRASTR